MAMGNDNRMLFFLQLFVMFGWIVPGLIGLIALVLGAIKKQPRRVIIGLILIGLGVFWAVVLAPLDTDHNYSKVRSPDGRSLAYIRSTGLFTNHVVVEREGQRWEFKLPAGPEIPNPERIFWLPSGKAIGVEYDEGNTSPRRADSLDRILDVFPIPENPMLAKEDPTKQELRDYQNWQLSGRPREPTEEEWKYFEK